VSFSPRHCMILAILVAMAPVTASAQVPDTDIWIADIELRQDGLHIENPVNVTQRPGYDNQPAFLWQYKLVNEAPPSTAGLLFVSADSLGTTDIYTWDARTRATTRVTQTAESEYSPTPFLEKTGSMRADGFYCVRVEADSTQRLWRFNIDGSSPRVFMADVDSVGYFAWIDDGRIAAFVLGNEKKKEPHTLRVIDVATRQETIVARGIGRSITRIPGSNDIAFTVQDDDETFRFMRLRAKDTGTEPLVDAMDAGQDAAWIPRTSAWLADTMLMSAGSALYASDAAADGSGAREAWRLIADFSGVGISTITRMVVSFDQRQIAFVATTATP